ncbi:MAG: hypothetical protein QOJ58_1258, partial [Alphaproteobacteria bacterium]|nr:hypothetical protein [Alphaproteobacteria bacterium]
PDVPTMVESGLPELALIFSAGLLAPAGTPADIIHKLNFETNEAMKTPELTASMAKLGFEPQIWPTENYAAFLAEGNAALAADREGRRREAGIGASRACLLSSHVSTRPSADPEATPWP